jgi:hypothetical protein
MPDSRRLLTFDDPQTSPQAKLLETLEFGSQSVFQSAAHAFFTTTSNRFILDAKPCLTLLDAITIFTIWPLPISFQRYCAPAAPASAAGRR